MKKVAAIIVTYNPIKSKLLMQKKELVNQVEKIIYVDNGSENQSDVSSITDSNDYYLSSIENVGIATAQNRGIACAKELGMTHVLLMDQDSIPTPNMVNELLKSFDLNTKVGAVGPYIENAFDDKCECSGVYIKGFDIKRIPLKEKFTDVSYVIASGCLIPIEVLDNVGYMDDSMFIDGVDFEWCLRARSKGYKVRQSKDAKLLHELGNGNSNKVLSHSYIREYYIVRNSIRMSRMAHIPLLYRIRRFTMSILRTISCLRPDRIEYFKSGIKGIKDGLISK